MGVCNGLLTPCHYSHGVGFDSLITGVRPHVITHTKMGSKVSSYRTCPHCQLKVASQHSKQCASCRHDRKLKELVEGINNTQPK